MSKIEKLVEAMAAPIAEKEGLEIYDVEFKKEGANYFLRVYLSGKNGVTLDHCEAVSRKLSDILDEKDPIAEPYYLEVSSPGIERVLSRPQHFRDAIGQTVFVRLYAPIDGQKAITGVLRAYDADGIAVEIEDGGICRVTNEKIAQVKTVFCGSF